MAPESGVAIVPAAGSGTRMGAAGPSKQFRTLGGAPLLVQTLRVFDRHPAVGRLVVVVPEAEVPAQREALAAAGLGTPWTVVAGGASRQASVACGLAAVEGDPLVLVHDAVRPFLSAERLGAVLAAAARTGAAALAVPVADTVRRGAEGAFGETVPREHLWRMQTPQAFRAALLRDAHARFGHLDGTDEVELVRRTGRPVAIVEGSTLNLKITRPDDWTFAEVLWPAWVAGLGDSG